MSELTLGGPDGLPWSYPNKYKDRNGDWVSAGMVYLGNPPCEEEDKQDLYTFLSHQWGEDYNEDNVMIDDMSLCGKDDDAYTSTSAWARENDPRNTVVF